MRSLIIYDSSFGNTKTIAEEIAQKLDNTIVLSVNEAQLSDLEDIDLLIIGSPINGWMPTEKIRNFLQTIPIKKLSGIKATAFDTRVKLFIHGDAKEKIAKSLKDCGASIIIKPEHFYVAGTKGPILEGEIGRATQWAENIKEKVASLRS